MRYKLGDNKPKRKGNITTLIDKMEPDRWYEVEELEKMAVDLNLNRYTVGNLLNYGVGKHYILPESEMTIDIETISNLEESSVSIREQPSIEEKIRQRWQENKQKKAEKEKKIAFLQREIANLTEKLEQEKQGFKDLNQEGEFLEEIIKSFTDNSAKLSKLA